MAQGVLELKESHHVDKQTETSIQYFLDRFYMSRISLKMLLNQHIMLFDGSHIPGKNAQIGMIDRRCNVCNLVRAAFEEAAILCEKTYTVSSKMFQYLYSTAPRPAMRPADMAALAGYGY